MNNYLMVLQYILNSPQTFQSNHFRGNASYYAEAASRGHTTCLESGKNCGRWKLTSAGHQFLSTHSAHTI